ncbi:MAG: polymer-forming cytoskeletal protein [Verrucomicrobiota bacterium]
MSKSRKVDVVDSYATIKAVARAADAHPAPPPAELRAPGAGTTALPPKKLIECFECGFKFQLHGRAANTTCNKCRAVLDLTDHIVDQRWTGTIKTGGMVRVLPNGVVESGTIIANDMVLEGVIESGNVRLMRRLEVRRGCRFSEKHTKATDLLVADGATIVLTEPAEYRDVELVGALRASLKATGTVTIHANGFFAGHLQTAHLTVEEGGGLSADVQVDLVSP